MTKDVSRLKDITVLYCEDEEYLRDVTKGILETFTKKQFIAPDGKVGLELFRQHEDEIDLIITDINMPNMNGLEMAKEIKAINLDIPIVVATAFSNSEYLLEAIDLGVDKYVLKPINIKKLLDTMNQSLMYHELRDLYKDSLTHLPNRNALIKDIKNNSTTLLALIDIDKFSVLNDLYGEEFGDKLLINFATQIKKCFKDHYKIYRVGSDRFAVLCSCQEDMVCEKNFKELSHQFSTLIDTNGIDVDDTNIDITITIGMAKSDDKHAFEYAQRAIQKARKKYLQILEFDESLFEQKKDIQENIAWVKKIKNGVANNYFHSFLQPIVDAKTQEIYKYEALIRYIGEDGKEIAPFFFLPIAKKAKLFPLIIKVMLTNVISIIQEKNIRVAVNLSFDDIINKESYDFIFNTLKNHPNEAKLVEFEILESEEIDDSVVSKSTVDHGGVLDRNELSMIESIISDQRSFGDIDNYIDDDQDDDDRWEDLSSIIDQAIDEANSIDTMGEKGVDTPIKILLNEYELEELKPLLNMLDQGVVDALADGNEINLLLKLGSHYE